MPLPREPREQSLRLARSSHPGCDVGCASARCRTWDSRCVRPPGGLGLPPALPPIPARASASSRVYLRNERRQIGPSPSSPPSRRKRELSCGTLPPQRFRRRRFRILGRSAGRQAGGSRRHRGRQGGGSSRRPVLVRTSSMHAVRWSFGLAGAAGGDGRPGQLIVASGALTARRGRETPGRREGDNSVASGSPCSRQIRL